MTAWAPSFRPRASALHAAGAGAAGSFCLALAFVAVLFEHPLVLVAVAAAAALGRGPDESGVFARFSRDGRRLELLDERGEVAFEAPPGSGLVAAVALEGQQLVWLVTGLDAGGVETAAAAIDERKLRDRFAIAAMPGPPGVTPLPVDVVAVNVEAR